MAISELLVAEGISRRYGSNDALKPTSVKLAAGDCVGLLGANGAGKSTLLRLLTGAYDRTTGRLRLLGHDIGRIPPPDVKKSLGVLMEPDTLWDELTGFENLSLLGVAFGLDDRVSSARSVEGLEALGLGDAAHDPVVTYSRGMRKKVALLAAVLHGPRILLLDEPFEGLDFPSALWLQNLLISFCRGREAAAVVATHQFDWIRPAATRILVLKEGVIEADKQNDAETKTRFEFADYVSLLNRSESGTYTLPSWL